MSTVGIDLLFHFFSVPLLASHVESDMTIEPVIQEELRLLGRALQQEVFRFVLIGHNRRSIYVDVAAWIRQAFPDRQVRELSFSHKKYRDISDEMQAIDTGIVLIPDFDWLFLPENEDICAGFNQRRDFYARRSIALICFLQPSQFLKVPKRIPDWWSIRSLDFDFHREAPLLTRLSPEAMPLPASSLTEKMTGAMEIKRSIPIPFSVNFGDGQKKEELINVKKQLALAVEDNAPLHMNLHSQLATLYYMRGAYDSSLGHWKFALGLADRIEDWSKKAGFLQQIGLAHDAQGEDGIALDYLGQALGIQQTIDDSDGIATTHNLMAQTYSACGDYPTALNHVKHSFAISRDLGNKGGESISLNNESVLSFWQGDHAGALGNLNTSLAIAREFGDKRVVGIILTNISQVHHSRGDYAIALEYAARALGIRKEIGDTSGEVASLYHMAMIALETGEKKQFIQGGKEAWKLAQGIQDPYWMYAIGRSLGQELVTSHQEIEALPYLQRAHEVVEDKHLPEAKELAQFIASIQAMS